MCQQRSPEPSVHETLDEILDGRLKIIQPRHGYRFSVDALFLADFVQIRPNDLVVDLGTGCGIIPLACIAKGKGGFFLGIEIQWELALGCHKNISINRHEDRFFVVQGDIRQVPIRANVADVVVCNPPYLKAGQGRLSPEPQRAIARQEVLVDLEGVISCAKYILRSKGRLAVIYPASGIVRLMLTMRRHGLEPKRIRFQHPRQDRKAKLVMVEAIVGARPGLIVEPPIYLQGEYQR